MAISISTRKVILDGELVPSPSHRRPLTHFRLLCSGLIRSFSGAPPYTQVNFMAGILPRVIQAAAWYAVQVGSLFHSSLFSTSMVFPVDNQLVWT